MCTIGPNFFDSAGPGAEPRPKKSFLLSDFGTVAANELVLSRLQFAVRKCRKKCLKGAELKVIRLSSKASCRLFWHLQVCSSCFKVFISRATFSEIIWAGASRQYRFLWRWNARRANYIFWDCSLVCPILSIKKAIHPMHSEFQVPSPNRPSLPCLTVIQNCSKIS